ncbi:conserved hypothetical protein [Hahella chejuensis KCTC 2396]|uniref:Uncharacterized protein n=1 Tax=Hahella chejuensis (strain KCTC 2396) TaxID=349521 RepID=Q2SFW7_HAHCH|nr:conserved hypothetical protein [Hahella chejuensis KCTC 2396]
MNARQRFYQTRRCMMDLGSAPDTQSNHKRQDQTVYVMLHEPGSWFLFEQDRKFYLDARCSRSFVDFSILIELNEEECEGYQAEGKAFIDQLATRINACQNEFLPRDITNAHLAAVSQAVSEWRETTVRH